MPIRPLVSVVLTSVAAATLTACSISAGSDESSPASSAAVGNLDAFYSQNLTWKSCEGAYLCTSFEVPLDYADTDGQRITLRALKAPAENPAGRQGSLVVNPGGPGASGFEYVSYSAATFAPEVRRSFDIIGLDQRGVGVSAPIRCLNDKQTDEVVATLGPPATPQQSQRAQASAQLIGEMCEARSPNLTPNVGTVPATRDLDILRALLGESKLNFLGLSYGSYVGLTYAELFTDKIGKFVLDGIIDPALSLAGLSRGQAEGFQDALGEFIADCRTHPTCPLPRGSQEAALDRINSWLAELNRKPIPAQPGRPLTRPLAVAGLMGSLYDSESGWPQLANALRLGFQGDGAPLLEIADFFIGRESDGKYLANNYSVLYAVNCLDRTDRADVAATEALAADWAHTAPTFGGDLAWGNLPCNSWPAPATNTAHPIAAEGSPTILLIGSRHDPATPFLWAESVHAQLANSALLAVNMQGHTSVNRNECVDQYFADALLRNTFPDGSDSC